jgi:hypothetical protein
MTLHCSFVHDWGLNRLEGKTRETLFHDMEAQFNLGSVGLDDDDKGLFDISWRKLWQNSGLDKLGWLDAVRAARGSSHNPHTKRPNKQHIRIMSAAVFLTAGARPHGQRVASQTSQQPSTRSDIRT